MQPGIFKKLMGIFSLLAIAGLTTLMASNKGGADHYTIYLNNKLLVRQFVGQPLTLKSLQLDQANKNDQLVIYYSHCGKIGQGRSIVIRDEEGNTLKEWKFPNASDAGSGMTISVKELLLLQKKGSGLNMYYASDELPKGRMLVGLDLSKKGNT